MIEVSLAQFAIMMAIGLALFICTSAAFLMVVLVIKEAWENRQIKPKDVE